MTALSASATDVRTFQIDKGHSEVTFQVRHLLTKVRGHFSDFDGAIQFNAAAPEASSVPLTSQAGGMHASQPDRDKHLRSGDFFAIDEFATLTFASPGMTRTAEGAYEVAGDLTIRGVTRPITLPV